MMYLMFTIYNIYYSYNVNYTELQFFVQLKQYRNAYNVQQYNVQCLEFAGCKKIEHNW